MRFPSAKSLEVDTLLAIYEGIIDDADKALRESELGGRQPKPRIPEGLEGYLRWTEHGDPLPPDDLTECTDLIIGKMFSYFQNTANYVSYEASRAKCLTMIGEKELTTVKSGLKIYYREEVSKPAGMVNDYVQVDKRFVDVDAAILKVKVFYETANTRYDQLKRTLNNVSREQTRRKEELERLIHDEQGGRDPTANSSSGGGRFGRKPSPRSFRE
jgi:hypothetical protein